MFYPLKRAQECQNAPLLGSILGPTALASRGIQAAPRYHRAENTYHPLNLLSLPNNPKDPHPWFPYPSLLHWMNSLVFLEARQDLRTQEARLDLGILVLAALLEAMLVLRTQVPPHNAPYPGLQLWKKTFSLPEVRKD